MYKFSLGELPPQNLWRTPSLQEKSLHFLNVFVLLWFLIFTAILIIFTLPFWGITDPKTSITRVFFDFFMVFVFPIPFTILCGFKVPQKLFWENSPFLALLFGVLPLTLAEIWIYMFSGNTLVRAISLIVYPVILLTLLLIFLHENNSRGKALK